MPQLIAMPLSKATVGIASIGDMGAGVAKLLTAHNYRVLTNVSDRRSAASTSKRSRGRRMTP